MKATVSRFSVFAALALASVHEAANLPDITSSGGYSFLEPIARLLEVGAWATGVALVVVGMWTAGRALIVSRSEKKEEKKEEEKKRIKRGFGKVLVGCTIVFVPVVMFIFGASYSPDQLLAAVAASGSAAP